jgi:hypothetical protein
MNIHAPALTSVFAAQRQAFVDRHSLSATRLRNGKTSLDRVFDPTDIFQVKQPMVNASIPIRQACKLWVYRTRIVRRVVLGTWTSVEINWRLPRTLRCLTFT